MLDFWNENVLPTSGVKISSNTAEMSLPLEDCSPSSNVLPLR